MTFSISQPTLLTLTAHFGQKPTDPSHPMKVRAPRYRVCTTVPVLKERARLAFCKYLLSSPAESQAWLCQDGSELIFRPSADQISFFVEFRCQFHADPMKSVNYGLLPIVIQFCQVHGNCIKVIRSGEVLPASGWIYSDVFRSLANRVVEHLAYHPKDKQACERLISSTINAMSSWRSPQHTELIHDT